MSLLEPASRLQCYGPWAVVTGASDGIGRAFALEAAAAGLNLVLVARRAAPLYQLAVELQRRHDIRCQVVPLDLGHPDAMPRLAAATADLEVGLLVAAAGFGSAGPLLERSPRAEMDMVAVNCSAVLAQCLHFGARMAQRRRGGVILLSSVVAFHGTPWSANYAATKAYVQSLAEGLREEWAGQGVNVVACAPGPVASGFAQRAGMAMGQTVQPEVVASQTLAALGRQGTVRPGALSKLLGWSLGAAPRALRVFIMGRIMRGMALRPGAPEGQ
ncbi:SDR family NAD(P)-dependent oxidoreductase [Variovorax sp. YR752]|uniref:SDR family NAD(P)-dependent oxidoreductase n=1 Tax=Variovorax sp. YR752 TaxID=1884383 RepID=UPI003138497D